MELVDGKGKRWVMYEMEDGIRITTETGLWVGVSIEGDNTCIEVLSPGADIPGAKFSQPGTRHLQLVIQS